MSIRTAYPVIPAKAGISCGRPGCVWLETPAYAGVTEERERDTDKGEVLNHG